MFDEKIKFKYEWRPYQAKVLKEVDKYIVDKKINIVAAPGSGKTVLGLELARKLGNAVLILSPTVTIKNQWIDRFITLFMPEGATRPDWISDNVYKLSYFNSITYQGLHYAYKRKALKNQVNEEETDDEIVDTNIEEIKDVDIKVYDLVSEIKKNKISTIVLDEAHHLKSEWWQSLTKVIEELKDVTIISLTATPPYDIEYSEWKKYSELCGNIDMEISVPELVAAKNLCPHQDYIYFSYPTKAEKEKIAEYENKVNDFICYLKNNNELIEIIKEHPYIKYTEEYVEEILENAEFYSSMLIFLNDLNIDIDRDKVKILGHNRPIPKLSIEWIEILLQKIIFDEEEYFEKYIWIVEDIQARLNKLEAIEKKKVLLAQNSTLKKYFENSISKLDSINKIVEAEFNNLKTDLRMVILTDFLRKEYLFEDIGEIRKIGVFPILLNLLKQNPNLNIAVLTGSIFMIPNNKKEKLIEITSEKGINSNDINFIQIEKLSNYSIVKTTESQKNLLMKSISTLFSNGDINIIIGTKSLLGEGWDEPSINSLILASFVGSYVLSNQMRGRAIRTNDNPNKTANVWHLVCTDENMLGNADFEMLKRRFNSFVGIGYNYDVLESGIERLDLIPKKFSKSDIDRYNNEIVTLSNNRENMYYRWFELIDEFGGNSIKMNNQIEVEKEYMKGQLSIFQVSMFLKSLFIAITFFASFYAVIYTIFYGIPIIIDAGIEIGIILIVFVFLYIFFGGIFGTGFYKPILQCLRALRFAIPREKIESVAKVVIRSLYEADIIKTEYKEIKIHSFDDEINSNIQLSIDGVTTHENNIIIESIREIFSNTENQRYILINRKKNNISLCYNVPSTLASKKELAEIFYNYWQKYICECKLIYTKSVEGRKILLEARKKTFNYISEDKFFEKKKPVSNWK